MTDLVASDVDNYAEIATRMALDPQVRDEMRGRILDNVHKLFKQDAAVQACYLFITPIALQAGRRGPGAEHAAATLTLTLTLTLTRTRTLTLTLRYRALGATLPGVHGVDSWFGFGFGFG